MIINKKEELLRIYKNKKGEIKYDFSQMKDKDNLMIIKRIIEPETDLKREETKKEPPKDKNKTPNTYAQNNAQRTGKSAEENILYNPPYPIIGTDESGKGDYFGPLVAAGMYCDLQSAEFLKNIGVADSKLLTDSQIKAIAKKIKENCFDSFSIIEISPERYNRLYEQLKCENQNLNSLLAWAHAKAIEELLSKKECVTAISDKFGDERYIKSKLQEKGRKINLIQVTKAERNIAVAAASILARDRFLEKLEVLSKKAGLTLPKGASPAVITAGKNIVRRKGKDALLKYAKVHFKTTDDIQKTD